MNDISLWNLAPLGHLMLLALLLAIGPLTWVWLKHRQHRIQVRVRRLTLLVLFLTFDLVLFGAFTRLTDSGLGCPDWPGCYGHASPLGAQQAIEQAQTAMPTGPVTHTKAWIEMIHRYLAMLVGVLILTLAVFSWRMDRSFWGWPSLTLLWVCLQGAFGALTVTMKLFPLIVTLHLLGGVTLLALLSVQLARQRHLDSKAASRPLPTWVHGLMWVTFVFLLLQIALGAWVSSNYAVLACDTYPMCQNQWWPAMDFDKAFEPWRHLGKDGEGDALPFQALTAIHMVHRWHAWIPALLMVWLAWGLHRAGLRHRAKGLVFLLVLQFITGISNAVLGWPMLAALMHTGTAALMLALLASTLATTSPKPAGQIADTFNRQLL